MKKLSFALAAGIAMMMSGAAMADPITNSAKAWNSGTFKSSFDGRDFYLKKGDAGAFATGASAEADTIARSVRNVPVTTAAEASNSAYGEAVVSAPNADVIGGTSYTLTAAGEVDGRGTDGAARVSVVVDGKASLIASVTGARSVSKQTIGEAEDGRR